MDILVARIETGTTNVTALCRDDPSDEIDACYFVDRVEPDTTGDFADPWDPTIICVGGLPVEDLDGDTIFDTFRVVPEDAGAICFELYPSVNDLIDFADDCIPPKAYIDVVGEGGVVLDSIEILFSLPMGGPEFPDTDPPSCDC
jgi:hypothetical protein